MLGVSTPFLLSITSCRSSSNDHWRSYVLRKRDTTHPIHGKYSGGLTAYWVMNATIVGFLTSGPPKFSDVAPTLAVTTIALF